MVRKSTIKPCAQGKTRNPATGRCVKIKALSTTDLVMLPTSSLMRAIYVPRTGKTKKYTTDLTPTSSLYYKTIEKTGKTKKYKKKKQRKTRVLSPAMSSLHRDTSSLIRDALGDSSIVMANL